MQVKHRNEVKKFNFVVVYALTMLLLQSLSWQIKPFVLLKLEGHNDNVSAQILQTQLGGLFLSNLATQ